MYIYKGNNITTKAAFAIAVVTTRTRITTAAAVATTTITTKCQ